MALLSERHRAAYLDDGFVVVEEVIACGEHTLLTVEYPTLIAADELFLGRANVEVLPPALLTRCEQLAAECAGRPLQLASAMWRATPPQEDAGAVDWHQDRRFWPAHRPETLTMWLALDPFGPETCRLEFAAGMHRSPELLPHAGRGGRLPTCADGVAAEATRFVDVSRGSALIYHERAPHRARPNPSIDWHRALALAWNDAGA